MQELASGVYYDSSFRNVNLGLVVTNEGVVVVDTPMMPTAAREWRRRAEAHGPIQYVVNTDHLQEHVMGNHFLPGDIIAHDETRGRMRMTDKAKEQFRKFVLENDAPEAEALMANYELRFPNITLFDHLTIHLGSRELEFIYLPGHTPNSVGLHLADAHILFAGDVVVNNYRAYLGLSNVTEWLITLQDIAAMELEWVIPGHGEPLRPTELGPLAEYLEAMRERVQDLIDGGRARDEVVSKMMPFFEEWPIDNTRRDEERNLFRQGIRQLYDQLTGRK
ncbi:MAG: MBL fold metallo-hydrolase [Ardenticatenales bacterium]|nr:MBL fold metallo-hydrolase [Ardenticatenales bacterium]